MQGPFLLFEVVHSFSPHYSVECLVLGPGNTKLRSGGPLPAQRSSQPKGTRVTSSSIVDIVKIKAVNMNSPSFPQLALTHCFSFPDDQWRTQLAAGLVAHCHLSLGSILQLSGSLHRHFECTSKNFSASPGALPLALTTLWSL